MTIALLVLRPSPSCCVGWGCKVTTMVRDVQQLVVRFSEKSPACRVSFSHFALTTPAPAYHFALRNYVFFNGRARYFPVHLSKC